MEFIKNNKMVIFLGIVICVILFLTQSYYKKTESYKLSLNKQLEISKEQIISITKEKEQLKIDYTKQLDIIKKKNKKTNIIIKKNVDGSSTKEIVIDENSEQSNKSKESLSQESNKEKESITEENKESTKESIIVEEEIKKEEVKKGNAVGAFLIGAGSIILCVVTHVCVF